VSPSQHGGAPWALSASPLTHLAHADPHGEGGQSHAPLQVWVRSLCGVQDHSIMLRGSEGGTTSPSLLYLGDQTRPLPRLYW